MSSERRLRKGRNASAAIRRRRDPPTASDEQAPLRPGDLARKPEERTVHPALVNSVVACGFICPLVLGAVGGVGPAILGLAAVMLLAAIGFLWASARGIAGPGRSSGVDDVAAPLDMTSDRKRRALRALRDLEFERSVGKLEDEDFVRLSSHYRAIAKDVLRDMDAATEPDLGRAEALITSYLASLPPSFSPDGKAPAHLGSTTRQEAPAEAPLHECAECRAPTRATSPLCDDCRSRRHAEDRSGGTTS